MSLRLRIRSLLGPRRTERELDDELGFHFEQQVAENLAAGMPRAEAERAARRLFGSIAHVEDECRDARGLRLLFDAVHDLRYAGRTFRRSPGFAVAAVLTLALGIGANTTVFSIADAVLLKMLPVPEPQRLVQILRPDVMTSEYSDTFSFVEYREMQQDLNPLAELAAERPPFAAQVAINGGPPESVRRSAVSGNYFQMLGVPPVMGRTLDPSFDNEAGRHPQAVISYGFWTRRFNRDRTVIGRSIRIGGAPFEIVGVAGAGFSGMQVGAMADVWIPLAMEPVPLLRARGAAMMRLFGRLHPGVSAGQALAPLQVSFHRSQMESLRRAPPGTPARVFDRVAQMKLKIEPAGRGVSPLRARYGQPIAIVFAVVAGVLLLACGNVANLLLARASARQREMAVRVSLGAGRSRLVRQLLTESLLLAGAAGAAGLAAAQWTVPVLVSMLAPADSPVQLAAGLDLRVLAFTAGISLLTVLAFGVSPALRVSKVDVHGALKSGGRLRSAAMVRDGRLLLALQMAVSLMLLLVSSLLVRTLINLHGVDAGFDRQNLMTAYLQYRGAEKGDRLRPIWDEMLRRVSSIPRVESASVSIGGPFGGAMGIFALRTVSGTPDMAGNWLTPISANYFATLGTRVVVGRDFEPRDFATGAPRVAILNQAAARRHFGDRSPLGQRVSDFEKSPPQWMEVVGVAPDMKFDSLRTATPPIVYTPYTQGTGAGSPFLSLEVRARRDSGSLGPVLRREVAAANPQIAVADVKPLTETIDNTLIRERLLARVGSFFGALALLLAAIGLYGTVTYSVARRTQEIGVRIALGARSEQVLRMVLGEALRTVAVGALIGIVGGVFAARLIASLLFGVQPHDAGTMASATLLLGVTACSAAFVPAARACRTDAVDALRSE